MFLIVLIFICTCCYIKVDLWVSTLRKKKKKVYGEFIFWFAIAITKEDKTK